MLDGRPTHEWWSKKAPQVYARYAEDAPGEPARWLPDGELDKPAPFNTQGRTYRQLTKAGLMSCPMNGCKPFSHAQQGVRTRSHYHHKHRSDADVHGGGPESVWHQQAKFAVHDWLAAKVDPSDLADLQVDNKMLPLRDGRRRKPDVYVEFTDGACVAFECQQQTMGGTGPKDHRAIWQARMVDYRELRETLGLQVVWLVSPWSTTANPKYLRDNVWRVEAYGGYAAQMLEAGESVYWIDPTFGQIGTLVEHIGLPTDLDLPSGYIKHARAFPKRGKWYWLHSDNINDCGIDPRTGIVTTNTDLDVQGQQWLADRHVELEAEKIAAEKREQAARADRIRQAARERATRDALARKAAQETARLWREKRDAETQEHRRREAEASQEAQRRALIHTAITISSVLAVLVFLGVLIFAP